MNSPDKAVILAAGYGHRLDPLTRIIPKPLLPFWNVPIITRTIRTLSSWGVREIMINLHHLPDLVMQIAAEAAAGCGTRVAFSFEPVIAGTGGALNRAAWFRPGSPFWLVNADIVMHLQPRPFLKTLRQHDPVAVLWMTTSGGPRTVLMKDGMVTTFSGGSPEVHGSFTFCGLHLLTPRIWEYMPGLPSSSIIEAYLAAMRAGEKVCGVDPDDAFWADIGTPDDYLDAHRRYSDWLRTTSRKIEPCMQHGDLCARYPGVSFPGTSAVARSAQIRAGASITDSVIMDNVSLGPRCRLSGSIVAPGVHLRGTAGRMVVQPGHIAQDLPAIVRRSLHWPARECLVDPLPPRGSDRSFVRLKHGASSVIFLSYGRERPENGLFAAHARFLRRMGIPVPRIIWHDQPGRRLLMEDLGSSSLLDLVLQNGFRACEDTYRKVLQAIVKWHDRGTSEAKRRRIELMPPFNSSLYAWEHDLFINNIVTRVPGIPTSLVKSARRDLRRVSRHLTGGPRVLLHRDLQSTNVMLCGKGIAFIDFQGMRMGHPLYDIASLLADPYVSLPYDMQSSLLSYYCRLSGQDIDRVTLPYSIAVVERLVQALGAFGRLSAMAQTRHFSRHIPVALSGLDAALARINGLRSAKALVRMLRG